MTHHHNNAVTAHGTVIASPLTVVKAPEIDPTAGFSAVLLLAGVLAVIMGRRARL